ncbi:MAG: MBL fold metallo-hydrolase [Acidobacteria bacterium]|nr:MAG: MBL fold metallo-hydrolase [Acidobacteriota bacterium]
MAAPRCLAAGALPGAGHLHGARLRDDDHPGRAHAGDPDVVLPQGTDDDRCRSADHPAGGAPEQPARDRLNGGPQREPQGRRGRWPRLLLLASLVGFGVWLTTGATQAESEHGEILYLGNEGVLVRDGEHAVLIDALFGDGLDGYAAVPEEVRRQVESATGEFDDVDLVLATHFHDDHFDPAAVARQLRANPEALFVSTPDAVGRLPAGVAARAVLPEEGEPVVLEHRGIRLTVIRMHHGRNRPGIQNLGFVVELPTAKILHVGDTELSEEEWLALELPRRGIDWALLPTWQVKAGTIEAIAPRRGVLALHLPEPDAPAGWFPSSGRDGQIAALERLPGVVVAQRSGARIALAAD